MTISSTIVTNRDPPRTQLGRVPGEEIGAKCGGIHHGDDAIQYCCGCCGCAAATALLLGLLLGLLLLLLPVVPHRGRVRDSGQFHHDRIQGSSRDESFHARPQFILQTATGAAVLQFNHEAIAVVATAVAVVATVCIGSRHRRRNQFAIDIDGGHVVDHDPNFELVLVFQQVLQRARFPRTKKACQQSDGNGSVVAAAVDAAGRGRCESSRTGRIPDDTSQLVVVVDVVAALS